MVGRFAGPTTRSMLDVEAPAPEDISKEEIAPERVSVEMRLQGLIIADETMGSQRLHQTLVDEGYVMSKKRVLALKRPLSTSLRWYLSCQSDVPRSNVGCTHPACFLIEKVETWHSHLGDFLKQNSTTLQR
jgi:hypothetical protein